MARRGAAGQPGADPQLAAFVAAARDSLRARGIGGRKGRAVSVWVDPDLLAAAAVRLAVLAGADTFGAWLLDQAGALDPDLDMDI